MNHEKKVLSYWRDLEIFNLPTIQDEAKEFTADMVLPWELQVQPDERKTWLHYVFLGKMAKTDVLAAIDTVIGVQTPEADFVERPSGDTFMAAMIIDQEGRPLANGGYLQTAYLHGLWCLANGEKLEKVNNRLENSQKAFSDRYPVNPETEDLEELLLPVIGWPHLRKERTILNDLGAAGLSSGASVHIRSVQIYRREAKDVPFLNSFYLDDLNNLIQKKKYSLGLSSFLAAWADNSQRRDIFDRKDEFFRLLHPQQMSVGRWPSDPAYGLYAAQLASVNHSFAELGNGGLLGINGPPGTGKTTLLKDVIADVVVSRAKKLITVGDHLFTGNRNTISTPGFDYHYYDLKPAVLEEAGIVVASNNNAAVENISKELPALKNISGKHFSTAGYLRDFSSGLIDEAAWGVLAAALGKAENKQKFRNSFWYGAAEQEGFGSFLQKLYNKGADRTPEMKHKFRQVAAELNSHIKEWESFKDTASVLHRSLSQQLKDEKDLDLQQVRVEQQEALLAELEGRLAYLQGELTQLLQEIASAQTSLQIHERNKPGLFWFHRLFNSERFRVWNEPYQVFMLSLQQLTLDKNSLQKRLNEAKSDWTTNKARLEEHVAAYRAIENRMEAYVTLRDKLMEAYGLEKGSIPDTDAYRLFDEDRGAFHKMNPWSSVMLNKLRSEIFIKSLELIELAIYSHAKFFWSNLNLFMNLLDGRVEVSAEMTGSLWKIFFFCVPVVSTSLASVGRLFGNIPPETIGWLLMDEAGQVSPPAAVGAISRARRSVIIGDPLQIKPVVTLPEKLTHILNTPYGLDMIWNPLRSSAQDLADRISVYGTYLGDQESKAWTGFPLRAHRRCNNPMFDLANKIAYNGQMVKVMEDVGMDSPLGATAWFHVEGHEVFKRQVISEELHMLREKLLLLSNTDHSVFVISPFKSVAGECTALARKIRSKALCGTIHTFQGKEADIVFMVLGSDPAKPGTRAWASSEPNMLNVALTRAKKRFYVIGNRKLWGKEKFFAELAAELGRD